MSLADAAETLRTKRSRLHSFHPTKLNLDTALMAATLSVCGLLFAEGGLEALLGGVVGALIAARRAERGSMHRAAYSGAFAGLFAGTLFAGFFHAVIDAALGAI